jgi:Zn-dependent protease
MTSLEPEPTRWDWQFRLFDTDIRVSAWFWLLPVLLGVLAAQFFGIACLFIVVGCWFVSVLLHEFGHVFAGRHFGADSQVVLTGFGGLAVGCAELGQPWQRVVVYLAGPAAQLLLGGTLWLTGEPLIRWLAPSAPPDDPARFTLLVLRGINIGWPLFNLLPVPPLDGFHVAREVWEYFRGYGRPPWERHANWWKAGQSGAGWTSSHWHQRRAARPRGTRIAVAVLVAIVVVVWIGMRVDRRRQRREAFARLEKLGAVAGWDEADRYYGFSFQGTGIGDSELPWIELFDEVEHIDLSGTRVTNEGLRHLHGLHGLTMLELEHTRVSDAGLAHLRPLTQLKVLSLSATRVTDAGLEHLVPLSRLEWLSLSHTRISDAGLEHLKDLPRLRYVDVHASRVTLQGVEELKRARPSLTVKQREKDLMAELPDISAFLLKPSDRFLVDIKEVSRGHPFLGVESPHPHAGGHVHFDNRKNRWPRGKDEPAHYPAIYAVADGVISRIDTHFSLPGGNDRYGVDLTIATGPLGAACRFCYSIEPMCPEPSEGFYKKFLLVKEGQEVRKGDVIAYLYTPPSCGDGCHIHFHLMVDGTEGFLAPAIFTPAVVKAFHKQCRGFRDSNDGKPIPPCMGYRISAEENPFGSGAKDEL